MSENNTALLYWQKALKVYKKSKDKKKHAAALGNIGMVYFILGQPEEALKYLKDSQQIYQKINLPIPESFANAIKKLSSDEEKKDKKEPM